MIRTKLAIVDDHELFAYGMKSLLEPYEQIEIIGVAHSGVDFLNQLKGMENLPDVVLMDLKMPEMDGIETMERLQKEYPSIKVIILSMHEDNQFILHLIKMGANGYLLKNSTITEVVLAIDRVMTANYYYNDFLMRVMREGLLNANPARVSLDNMHGLTSREFEVLDLICKQFTTEEIGDKLFLSKRTVEGYRNRLLEKTNTKNTAGLIMFCINKGIINSGDY
jgi:two-component system response regulator DegU